MSHNKRKVLIADDYDDIRTFLCKLLEQAGASCDEAADGIAAMRAYRDAEERAEPYALLILDAAMPRATGYEVAEFVRKAEGDDSTPIFIVTGSDGPLIEPHALHVGVTEVWYKPLDPHKFMERVAEVLGSRCAETFAK
jgi:CheY-like chemotaxis protein